MGSSGRGAGTIVWITGLPSSGKSTLAEQAAEVLRARGWSCCVLDGDAVRRALVPPPGYSDAERDAFYATLAALSALLAAQGHVVIVAATAHRRAYRECARSLWPRRFIEVYVRTDPAECARRDAKGLYEAARAGRLGGLPGVDLAYEPPPAPEVVAESGRDEAAIERILERLREASSDAAPGRDGGKKR